MRLFAFVLLFISQIGLSQDLALVKKDGKFGYISKKEIS